MTKSKRKSKKNYEDIELEQRSNEDSRKNRSRLKKVGHWFIPYDAAINAFNFGRNFTRGSKAKREKLSQSSFGFLSKRWAQSKVALFNPPIWNSIEEMEKGWGIDDGNRAATIRGMSNVRIVYFIITLLSLAYLVVAPIGNYFQLIMFISLLVTLSFLLLQVAVHSWRIYCLKSRRSPNFIQYLKGG